jgi:hypothetical protein
VFQFRTFAKAPLNFGVVLSCWETANHILISARRIAFPWWAREFDRGEQYIIWCQDWQHQGHNQSNGAVQVVK